MAKKIAAKSKTAKRADAKSPKPTFEESLSELERTVADLESGKLGLSESLEKYESGVKVLKDCYQALQDAEQKIELLSRIDESGEVQVEPFKTTDDA